MEGEESTLKGNKGLQGKKGQQLGNAPTATAQKRRILRKADSQKSGRRKITVKVPGNRQTNLKVGRVNEKD